MGCVKGVSSMAVLLVVAALLLVAPAPAEGSTRALLNLGKLIDHFLDCPPPPAAEEAPAPEPAPSATPYSSPPDVEAPAPDAYGNVPEAPESYRSPPGPPYADSPPVDSPSPVSEPAPEYQTPPAGGY